MISIFEALGAGVTAVILCFLLGYAFGKRARYTHYLRHEIGEVSQTFQARSLEELTNMVKSSKP